MKNYFDKYDIFARYIPAMICTVPIFIFLDLLKINIQKIIKIGDIINIEGVNISVTFAFIFLFIFISRYLGKFVFEQIIFSNELKFPTTELLLESDERLSKEIKIKLYQKIKVDFGIDLEKFKEENSKLRKIIRDTVSQIRLKVGNGKLLLNYNIQYGFFRNLLGGLLIALPVSCINIWVSLNQSKVYLWISILFSIMAFVLLLFSKQILTKLAENYAKRLYDEYLFQ